VDFKRFKLPDWLLVGGGAVVFLFGFFDWFDTGSASSSAFKFTITGVFPWLLIVGSALLTYQIRTGILTVKKWSWPTIFLLATIVGAILILIRVIIGADTGDFGAPDGVPSLSFDRKFTLWISFLGAVAAAAGVTPATMPKKANVVITMMPILATGDAVRPRGEPLSGVMATPSL
jgi:hypothetical protein